MPRRGTAGCQKCPASGAGPDACAGDRGEPRYRCRHLQNARRRRSRARKDRIDRGLRELPIHADYVGLAVATERDESVRVLLSETGDPDRVVLRARERS